MATLNLSLYSENEKEFMTAFGRVLAEWSYVENSLFGIFMFLTRLDEADARNLFYSSRSFSGRSDMLKAVVAAYLGADGKNAFEQAIQKAISYNAFRNRLAHNIPITNATSNGAEIILVEGKKKYASQEGTVINIVKLNNALVNFNTLAHLTDLIRGYVEFEYFERLPGCIERLRTLPSNPGCLQN